MPARPAKGKLVELAEACLPRPRAEQPFGRGNHGHSGDPGCRPDRRLHARGVDRPRVAERNRFPSLVCHRIADRRRNACGLSESAHFFPALLVVLS
jgi:hypothetical protein